MKFFGSIEKVYKGADGFPIVCGYASTEALDSQGEIVKREAIEGALADYMVAANVREMHQPSAVGKCIEARLDEKGLYIEAKIVDPVAALKVEESVYTGFSIGGRSMKKSANVISALRLTEISLVDRPANPEAVFTMFKADDLGEPAAEAQEEAQAEPAVEKGMGHVSDLAYLLKAISFLVADQKAEAAREGDASPVPAALQAWLEQGGAILQAMTAEEVAELTAPFAASVVDEFAAADTATQAAIQNAEQTGDVEKKGAKYSKDTAAALVAIRDALKQVLGNFDTLGLESLQADGLDALAAEVANPNPSAQPEGDTEAPGKADAPADLQKVDDLETIRKAHDAALAKAEELSAEIAKLGTEKETLAKRVADLESQPAPPKAGVRSIGKADDVIATDPRLAKTEALLKSDDPVQVMRGIHARGARIGFPV